MDYSANKYVWYASYGSNLSKERFLCYILGGKPKGSEKIEVGCRDKSLPKDEATFVMNYPLYFAKNSRRWQNQGVGFIGLTNDSQYQTYSRMYLITEDQFKDVVKQENNGIELNIDFNQVELNTYKTLRDSWYGTILFIGKKESIPIFTFTADWDLDVPFSKPSDEYLSMIIEGLKQDVGISKKEIINYLLMRPGIAGNYSKDQIEKLIR
ncbi:hypothetical protein [Halalkalibacter okhensis]|uniref:Histone deacetylase n=1 Tax=Halalkalibacter okhensis TaxID=333138 RepID=A0A0B0IDK7_9BACI|nr:hypothetical protein [Halalkalibacter okhensis]KHF38159.1 hypothetical protein LQ50_22900 [Halalkalibacter okhensis]